MHVVGILSEFCSVAAKCYLRGVESKIIYAYKKKQFVKYAFP